MPSVDPSVFDAMAESYDKEFSGSGIGKAQRDIVWRFLETALTGDLSQKVLEINCGTGVDAKHLAEKGHSVTATDISVQMIEKASRNSRGKVSYEQCAIQNLSRKYNQQNFSMVYSNFGGINCLNSTELEAFFNEMSSITEKSHKLILVIMSSACLWEFIYFFFTLKWGRLFRRRKRSGVEFLTDSGSTKVYYYSPLRIKRLAKKYQVRKVRPVGFFIPPSYMEPYFSKRPGRLRSLIKCESWINSQGWLSNFADHYYIELVPK